MAVPPSDQIEDPRPERFANAIPPSGHPMVPLVGIGGSAGAIPALQRFFAQMPAQSGMAFVVILHLSPDHDSALHQLLQRGTSIRVMQVVERIKVEPDTIYVIPPRKWLRVAEGHLHLDDTVDRRDRQVAVDLFFRTLADSNGTHSAAIVLSGADGDGAIGIKRIKERGGLTIAQDPQEAEQSGMPLSSIGTGMVDWVLPVEEMAPRLLAYFRMAGELRLPPEDPPTASTALQAADDDEGALRDVLTFLRTCTGRDFGSYKRATILRRIARRMQVNGIEDLAGYLTCLRMRPGEAEALLHDLLISVTNFFRDEECFGSLEAQIPALFIPRRASEPIRAWVVACATGEEAYSVAMLLAEHARTLEAPPVIQVFATDLDERALQVAREGMYPTTIEADVPEDRLRRFFVKEHRGYRVRRELREMVLFAQHDVLKDSPFSRVDLITCRNLLIYLAREAQERLFDVFHFALLPGGRLFLGSSESVDESSQLFSVLDKKHRLYAQRPAPRSLRAFASGPGALAVTMERAQARPDSAFTQLPVMSPRLPRGMDGRQESWGEMHLRLLEELSPPSVLVDAEHDIVHLSPRAGRFLQYRGGEPSRNLVRMAHPSLRIELRAALYQSTQGLEPTEIPPIRMELDGEPLRVVIRVTPARELGAGMFLVVFDDRVPGAGPIADQTGKAMKSEGDPADHPDRELERVKAHLRDTVAQYEASTEELKASNEELQAMNEELRSATEELETSREELQSINEELTTVNQELKSKVDELGRANSDMHNLMDATAIATVFLDRDLCITRYTPSAGSIFSFIPTDLGRPLTDLTTNLQYSEMGDDAQRVLDHLVPIEREVGQTDGTWFLARLLPYRTIDDRIAGVVLTFVNITERRQSEEMRQWLSAVVTSSSDAIINFSLDQTILSWNGGAERVFGYAAEEAIGKPMKFLVAKGKDGADIDTDVDIEGLSRGKVLENHETLRRRKDGRNVHVAISVSPIRDDYGKVMAGTAMVRDISSSREAAEALRRSEETMRMVVENATEYAIFSMDLHRRITTWNAGAQRLLGYLESEVLGQSADMIFTPEDRARTVPAPEAATALAEGRSTDDRFHLRKDGSRFWASGSMMLMRNARGDAAGFVKILRDQTTAREAQDALRHSREELLTALDSAEQARADLEAADGAKDRFLAVLSHELRNPLASITSAADLLGVRTSIEEDRDKAREVVARQSLAMRTLLDDLLDISRLRLGRLEMQRRPTGLGDIVLAAVETTRPLAEAAGHHISLQLPAHEIEVNGDPLRLGQVVANLLTNAIKYTRNGGRIVVSIELGGDDVMLAVADNGMGIPAHDIGKVFDMFTQASDAVEHSRGGLGIGLALVRNIVQLHEGRVEGESPGVGQGSTFRVYLPVLRTTRARTGVTAPSASEALREPTMAPATGQPVRVLLVDDNVDVAWSVGKLLELSGYQLRIGATGEEALRIAKEWAPMAIVLDIGLPDLDGRDVAQRIRSEKGGAGIILIAATGWGQESDVRESLEAGFDAHLTKPIHIQQLLEMLEEQLTRRGTVA